MVAPSPNDSSDRHGPFALRGALYTIGFLVFILGIVPSAFHLAADGTLFGNDAAEGIRRFWEAFRRLVGLAVFSIGLAAYLGCAAWLMYFGRGPHVEFDPPKVFVASGPYRWVRNPVVLTLMVTVLGEAIYFGSLGIFLLLLIGMPLAHLQVTKIEEPRLRTRFGDSYRDYCGRVPRWLPRPPFGATPASDSAS